jgi:aminopeptidase N
MFLRRRLDLFFLILLMSVSHIASVSAEERPAPTSYNLKVALDPAQQAIAVRGTITLPIHTPSSDLRFALHETFTVKRLEVNGKAASFSFQTEQHTPMRPATHIVVVTLPSDSSPDALRMDIEYKGKLKDLPEFGASKQPLAMDDQINSRLVELANYSSWYPQFGVFGAPINVGLEVSLPKGWTAICSGRKVEERAEGGRSITQWSSPGDTDILITAAPNYKMKSARLPGGNLEIYYTQLPDEFVSNEMRQIEDVMKLFTDRLGETTIPAGTVKQVYSPKRHGQGRAGIARPGMIVTSEGVTLDALAADRSFSLLQDVAHEIAHFWWNFGAGQGDWINEAFAEYFSAVAVENVASQEKFEGVLKYYRQQVKELPSDAPSLAKVPFDGSSFVVRYYKGSLMLDSIRHALGDKQFFHASRDFFQNYKGKPTGTAEFRSFWSKRLGGQSESLDTWLDSTGGVPIAGQSQQTGSHL